MRGALPCFVDSGAWIALAISSDPYHDQAKSKWLFLTREGGRIHTSVPVIIETFTFLDQNTSRATALQWKDSVYELSKLSIWECSKKDLEDSWRWYYRKDLYKLSAVDATSFSLMLRHGVKKALAFDTHFATAGFGLI